MSTPSGRVYLVENAIIDQNCTHTITFKNSSEQLDYWSSLTKYSVENVTYIRRSSQCIRVDYSLDELQKINYLYYRAKEDSKLYYCFVTNKEYYSDNTTYIYFVTDVMQTYQFDYEVKQSFVLQEHCDRWDNNHKPIYSRTEENLDYGSEYTLEKAFKVLPTYDEIELHWYLVLCTPDHPVVSGTAGEPTSITETANAYSMYLIPSKAIVGVLKATYYSGVYTEPVSGAISTINDFIKIMSKSAFGEYVQQIIKLNYLPFDFKFTLMRTGSTDNVIDTTHEDMALFGISELKEGYHFLKIRKIEDGFNYRQNMVNVDVFKGITSALPTEEQWLEVVNNPYTTERDKRFESKLLTHPYRYNLLTDWRTTPQVIKNEYIGGDKLKINFAQSFSNNSPVRFWVENYRKDVEGRANSVLQLTPEEQAVINDQYYSYMLANKSQIEANQTNAIISGATNTVTSAVGNIASGNLFGALGSILEGSTNTAVNYQNMVRGENAKQRDLKNLPDTIVNTNDCSFNIIDKNSYITFYRYKICCEFEEQLADTFAMTGYTVKRVKIPNLKTRVRYNYVKTVGANITGSFDQEDLRQIKAIFDNGITFWHYNKINFKPYDYSLENIERSLVNV